MDRIDVLAWEMRAGFAEMRAGSLTCAPSKRSGTGR